MSKQVVEVAVSPEIDADQLKELIVVIGARGPLGCRTCGLGGIDLRLTAVDPEIKELPAGVKSVVIA
jgi:hypothetical protein